MDGKTRSGAATDAGIYTRVSKKKGQSVVQQETAGLKACEAGQWPVAEVYTDSISASRYARKGRPGWQKLLADLDRGRFGVLVVWECSRGDRTAESWLTLLRRCREHHVRIHVITHGRTYDLTNARDWRTLAEDGIDSDYESQKTSLRIKRDLASKASHGRPHGMTTYGYKRIYDKDTGKLDTQVPDPETAPVVAEIFTRIAAAEPLAALIRDLTGRGIPSPSGGKWYHSAVRSIALNPAYIGKRRHTVQDTGEQNIYDAKWPPIVDVATFERCAAILNDAARKTTRPGRWLHLLSYLATCGTCGAVMYARIRRGRFVYECSGKGGCTCINQEATDDWVTAHIIGRLARPDAIDLFTSGAAGDELAKAARDEAALLRMRLTDAQQSYSGGRIPITVLEKITSDLVPRIEAAERRARPKVLPAGAEILTQDPDREAVEQQWNEMPVPARREIIGILIESIKVHKAKPGPLGFRPDRVKITPRRPI